MGRHVGYCIFYNSLYFLKLIKHVQIIIIYCKYTCHNIKSHDESEFIISSLSINYGQFLYINGAYGHSNKERSSIRITHMSLRKFNIHKIEQNTVTFHVFHCKLYISCKSN